MKATVRIWLSLFLLSCSLLHGLYAQEVDHLYLRNGSIIRGSILEIQPEDHVRIQDLCGNIWNYPMKDVEKITTEPFSAKGIADTAPPGFDAGFVNTTSMGFLAGSSHNAQVAPFSLLMTNGWRNHAGLFAGAGIGIEFLSSSYLPLFLDVRYDLMGSDVVPYVAAKGGYSLPLSPEQAEYDIEYTYSGGPLVGAGAGLKIKTREHFAWDISLLYRYQKTSYTEIYGWNNQEYQYTDVYNRIEIRLGFYID